MEAGTFRKVIVSFLPVGHTHEDIDQFFSRIGMLLRRKDAHSRIDLARIIGEVNASSKEWGKVRLVRHWESIANISDWLSEARVCSLKGITEFHQFRLMKDNYTEQVLLQARDWPGARGGYWSGFTKSDTSQKLWLCENVPNLLEEYSLVPPSLAPENPPTLETRTKVRSGVLRLLEHLHASKESTDDTLRLLDVYESPAASFPFQWDKDDIRSLLGDENRSTVFGEVPDYFQGESWKFGNNDKFEVMENMFYLMEPSKDAPEPFWICKVRRRVMEHMEPMVYVQWWEPLGLQPGHGQVPDYFKGKYGPALNNPSTMPIEKLDKMTVSEGFTTPIDLKVKKNGQATIVPGNKGANYKAIQFYMGLWNRESNMHMEADEVIPLHLMPKGRIDEPIPQPRQKRRKAVQSSSDTSTKKKTKESRQE